MTQQEKLKCYGVVLFHNSRRLRKNVTWEYPPQGEQRRHTPVRLHGQPRQRHPPVYREWHGEVPCAVRSVGSARDKKE